MFDKITLSFQRLLTIFKDGKCLVRVLQTVQGALLALLSQHRQPQSPGRGPQLEHRAQNYLKTLCNVLYTL